MAKDGTVRGGPRTGSGRKSKALTDKIADGNPGKIKDFDRFIGLWVMLKNNKVKTPIIHSVNDISIECRCYKNPQGMIL